MEWARKVHEKRQQRSGAIPQEWTVPDTVLSLLSSPLDSNPNSLIQLDIVRHCDILTERELEITEDHTVEKLLEYLASGELTSVQVTTAFCKRAAIAHQLVRYTSYLR